MLYDVIALKMLLYAGENGMKPLVTGNVTIFR
jgi:hypothetical protein